MQRAKEKRIKRNDKNFKLIENVHKESITFVCIEKEKYFVLERRIWVQFVGENFYRAIPCLNIHPSFRQTTIEALKGCKKIWPHLNSYNTRVADYLKKEGFTDFVDGNEYKYDEDPEALVDEEFQTGFKLEK